MYIFAGFIILNYKTRKVNCKLVLNTVEGVADGLVTILSEGPTGLTGSLLL